MAGAIVAGDVSVCRIEDISSKMRIDVDPINCNQPDYQQ
jgi:hypothetical protein